VTPDDKEMARRLILVCNSHIDPVWLWPWEEGVAAALATFRAAADLCEEFEGFAFCHNEAILYRWIEEYEPALFERIRGLVRHGRWHIIGGWYLQPDCNLPSGESLVRHSLVGKRFFLEKFGVEPGVAVNFDSFGHGRGLVQILKKAGYSGYLFCRPDMEHLALPADDFVWVGYDGSEILAHRAADHYNSERGQARAKVERWLAKNVDRRCGLLLWGVGNHGGGPSREDLRALTALISDTSDRSITHGRPEDYFAEVGPGTDRLPRHAGDLNPWAVGCYTSMALIKQAHRRLENAFYATEKTATMAALQGLIKYPRRELRDALEDLLFCEFHDILPGSSVSEVETQALQRLDHGIDTAARVRARAFFALLSGQPAAAEGEYPVLVHNPHPFAVGHTVVCELQPPEPNLDRRSLLLPELFDESGQSVPLQVEKESSNVQVDQRKRLVFRARLAPATMTRFACRFRRVQRLGAFAARPVSGRVAFVNGKRSTKGGRRGTVDKRRRTEVEIDGMTGLIARFAVDGIDYLSVGACRAMVMKDYADPWGMKVRSFRDAVGEFRLMSRRRAAVFAGVSRAELSPVRLIEEGPVRTIIEALFEHEDSTLCLRYTLPTHGSEVEIDARIYWMEKDRLVKLSLPTPFAGGLVRGQAAYGVERHQRERDECVAQKWLAVTSPDGRHALTVINDSTYGFDFTDGELGLSLLRSPAYAGHPVDDLTPIVRQDRFEARVDQGERRFRFWLNAGPSAQQLATVDREATAKNEAPMALCVFPRGEGRRALPGLVLSDDAVQLGAMKRAEDGERVILRLFEPTGERRATTVSIPPLDVRFDVVLGPFEIKTLAVDPKTKEVYETDLLERRVPAHP
jgi:alpha-mannosidase